MSLNMNRPAGEDRRAGSDLFGRGEADRFHHFTSREPGTPTRAADAAVWRYQAAFWAALSSTSVGAITALFTLALTARGWS